MVRVRPMDAPAGSLPPDFTRLWRGTALSQFGATGTVFAAPLLALSVTRSAVFAGWVTAAATLPRILLLLPVGVLIDRLNRRRIMIGSQLVRALAVPALMGAVLLLGAPPELLLLCAMVQGVCITFYNTAETTVVPSLVPRGQLPRAMARNEAGVHAADLVGRPVGGLLFGVARGLPFVVDALAALVAVLAVVRMRTRAFRPARPGPGGAAGFAGLTREMGEGMAFLWRHPFLRRVMLVCAATNFLFQTLGLLLMVLAKAQHLPSAVIGVLFAASGLGGLLGSLVAPRLLRRAGGPARMIMICVWGWLALLVLLVALDHAVGPALLLAALPVVWGGISFVGAHMNVALAVVQSTEVPRRLLARVLSANRFFTGGTIPLGAMFSGYLIAMAGARHAPAVLAAAVAALAAVLTFRAVAWRALAGRARVWGAARGSAVALWTAARRLEIGVCWAGVRLKAGPQGAATVLSAVPAIAVLLPMTSLSPFR
ncbi:MFS transporter [Spirillospora sp. CA-253888]